MSALTPFIPVIAVAIVGLVALVCIEIRRANRSLPLFGPRTDAKERAWRDLEIALARFHDRNPDA
jgi:hypothetical protein